MIFRAGHFEFIFPRPTLVMGIVNVTPDSFSDGGTFRDPEAAVKHGLDQVAGGADILDVGGESTRPGACPVDETEELRRVLPVIEGLAGKTNAPISIDTMKPGVARAALRAGACIVNDVAANREDDAMWRVTAEAGAGYVCMHMQGSPLTMQANPIYSDVVAEVAEFLAGRIRRLNNCGIGTEQIIVDPGIGFGKTLAHNLQLLSGLRTLKRLERPVLIGVSRKSFISKVTGGGTSDRLPGALACACLAAEAGIEIIRAHDVAQTAQALRMTEAILTATK